MDTIQSNLEQEPLSLSPEESKVADIVFSFSNNELLVLLQKRYKSLCKAKFDKAEAIEQKMT
mgnify:FL=1